MPLTAELLDLQTLYNTLKANVSNAHEIHVSTDRDVNNAVWDTPNAAAFRSAWTSSGQRCSSSRRPSPPGPPTWRGTQQQRRRQRRADAPHPPTSLRSDASARHVLAAARPRQHRGEVAGHVGMRIPALRRLTVVEEVPRRRAARRRPSRP